MHKNFWLAALTILFFPILLFAQIDPWKNRVVISVQDADTLVLDNGEVAKLIGITSPQAKHGKKEGQPFGDQARALTEDLLLGKKIEISFDRAYGSLGHRDQFGRALIYVTFSRGIEKDIANTELLKLGAGFYTPAKEELQIDAALKSAEAQARKQKVGIWTNAEKSPIEIAEAEGKSFQEPEPSLNLIYIRPSTPILQGPGVNPNDLAINRPTSNTSNNSNNSNNRPPAAMSMDDLRKTNPNTRPATSNNTTTVKNTDPDEDIKQVYDVTRSVFFSTFDQTQKLELYKAVNKAIGTSYRISIKQENKEIIFITTYDGLKDLEKLLSKGTDSQPTLTAVQTSVGSFGGKYGTSVTVSTGKDGGLVLNLSGRDGTTKFYLTRQSALKMQIAIGNI